jgi:hypothetical protein
MPVLAGLAGLRYGALAEYPVWAEEFPDAAAELAGLQSCGSDPDKLRRLAFLDTHAAAHSASDSPVRG